MPLLNNLFAVLTLVSAALLLAAIYVAARRAGHKLTFTGILTFALAAWLGHIAYKATSGYFMNFAEFPPAIGRAAFLANFVAILLVAIPASWRSLAAMSPAIVVLMQMFRIWVELGLYQMAEFGLVPEMMTFHGRNFDILTGLTAPLAVALTMKEGRIMRPGWLIAWNLAGLALLANIVTIAILSMPTPSRYFFGDVANTGVGMFPFAWLPAFLVPLALLLHLVSLRQAWATRRQ